jgi:hypothetical protein
MQWLVDLWMPIGLSAVLVFVASSIIWMATPIHKNDYKNPGNAEESILGMLRSAALAPGVYYVPWCHGKQNNPAAMERMKAGPWAMLTVIQGPPTMGKTLGFWFLYLVVVSVFVAYIAAHAGLPPGTPYLHVFRVAGTAAFMAYAGGAAPLCIWHGLPWSRFPGRLFDAVVFALVTAGTFGWLWPHAAAIPHA